MPERPDLSSRLVQFLKGDVGFVLALYAASRAILLAIGVHARSFFQDRVDLVRLTGLPWLDMWAQWDSFWYLRIARDGYPPDLPDAGYSSWGFFPLLPWSSRLVGLATGDVYVAGLIVTNAAFLVGCTLLYGLVREEFDEKLARGTLAMLFAYPTAFVFSGYLTEPLYFGLVVACFSFARRGAWWLVGLLGACLALTRPTGVLILLPLLWIHLRQRPLSASAADSRILALLLVPLGLGIFLLVSYLKVGTPFAYVEAQQMGWGTRLSIGTLVETLDHVLFKAVNSRIGLAFMLATAILLGMHVRKIPPAYWIYSAYSLLVPLVALRVLSFPRFSAAIFPIFLMLAMVTARSSVARWSVLAASAVLQAYLAFFWAAGALLVV